MPAIPSDLHCLRWCESEGYIYCRDCQPFVTKYNFSTFTVLCPYIYTYVKREINYVVPLLLTDLKPVFSNKSMCK